MGLLRINQTQYPYFLKTKEIPPIDPTAWLLSKKAFPKVFWKDRDHEEIRLAVGAILAWESLPDLSHSPANIHLYGGSSFDGQIMTDPIWEGFPKQQFWLPKYEIVQTKEKTLLHIHSLQEEEPDFLNDHFPCETKEMGSFTREKEIPSYDQWQNILPSILEEMQSSLLKKVVLARKVSFFGKKEICGWQILKQLKDKEHSATVFAFQFEEGSLFLGASPEKLYSRHRDTLRVDALAGTRKRGSSEEEDQMLAQDLLSHPKDLKEFLIVKEAITASLLPYTLKRKWNGKDQILKTPYVQHLSNLFIATLKEGMKDQDLVFALHPTPAIGGYPKQDALDCIRRYERFDRGWYAAPIGVLSKERASFVVAIRSALVTKTSLHLFSGVGIIPTSQLDKEWKELEYKIAAFLHLI